LQSVIKMKAMFRKSKMDNKGLLTYQDTSKEIQADIDRYVSEGKTLDAFLMAKCHVNSLKELDFDIRNKEIDNFGFEKIRGSVNLIMGNIRTFKESQDLVNEVLAYDFGPAINYKP